MARKTTKAVAIVALTCEADVCDSLRTIGEQEREALRLTSELTEKVERLKAEAQEKIDRLRAVADAHFLGIATYATARRDLLTENGKRKSVTTPAGVFGWRTNPASVRISNEERALQALKDADLAEFIRLKEEVNKTAILENPTAIHGVKGIKIVQDELFFVKPNDLADEFALPLDKLGRTG